VAVDAEAEFLLRVRDAISQAPLQDAAVRLSPAAARDSSALAVKTDSAGEVRVARWRIRHAGASVRADSGMSAGEHWMIPIAKAGYVPVVFPVEVSSTGPVDIGLSPSSSAANVTVRGVPLQAECVLHVQPVDQRGGRVGDASAFPLLAPECQVGPLGLGLYTASVTSPAASAALWRGTLAIAPNRSNAVIELGDPARSVRVDIDVWPVDIETFSGNVEAAHATQMRSSAVSATRSLPVAVIAPAPTPGARVTLRGRFSDGSSLWPTGIAIGAEGHARASLAGAVLKLRMLSASGAPRAHATLVLRHVHGEPRMTMQTDSEGTVMIRALPAGAYSVRALDTELAQNVAAPMIVVSPEQAAGAQVLDQELRAEHEVGTIRGLITTADAARLVTLMVSLTPTLEGTEEELGGRIQQLAWVGSDGRFVFGAIPYGDYVAELRSLSSDGSDRPVEGAQRQRLSVTSEATTLGLRLQ
jgi:hypothetical protein